MKKFIPMMLCAAALCAACVSLSSCGETSESGVKIGFISIGDESEEYSKAHIDGVKAAAKTLGVSEPIFEKPVAEDVSAVKTAAESLISEGCNLVISNSYGHQYGMVEVAKEHPEQTFVSCTGDFAAISGLSNFKNAFTNVYEARYVSGVAAGLKLQELINDGKIKAENKDADGNIKIGYVGAYTYAEVKSGYTAFFLGLRSVVKEVAMEVQFTSSWFDYDKEASVAETLVNDGCVIIGQHADSKGAPNKVESLLNSGKVCYSVGYNADMRDVAPNAALTSSTNVWAKYYEYAISQAMEGKEISADWSHGYDDDAVGITDLGNSEPSGSGAKIDAVVAKIKNGTLHVFDNSTFTVGGKKVESAKIDLSYRDWANGGTVVYQGETVEAMKTDSNGTYFSESTYRSAPYFELDIDGITMLNK
ncbi:MAG: BMP family ABC transporter substrate-binding protein [Bacilli bacterium]